MHGSPDDCRRTVLRARGYVPKSGLTPLDAGVIQSNTT
jgi:hypothetical protein